MKVILLKDYPSLGRGGEIKEVSEGYANNFLFPRQIASSATKAVVTEMESKVTSEKNRNTKKINYEKKLLNKLRGKSITINEKSNEQGVLYRAVTSQIIREKVVANFKVEVDENKIKISSPIKHIGKYDISIDYGQIGSIKMIIKVV